MLLILLNFNMLACVMLLLIPYHILQVTCKIQGIFLAFYKYSR